MKDTLFITDSQCFSQMTDPQSFSYFKLICKFLNKSTTLNYPTNDPSNVEVTQL